MDVFDIFSSWFMLLCSLFGIICAFLFIVILLLHRQCRTMAILLVLNSIVAGFIANLTCLCQSIYQIMNVGEDKLCPLRGFLLHVGTAFLYHTLCVQAFHRLFVTVYSARRYLQSPRVIISIVVIQWIISITFGLPVLFTGHIVYQTDSRMCQVSFYDIFSFIYFSTNIYIIPVTIIIQIYIHIIRYVKRHSFRTVTRQNILVKKRQKREIVLIRRTVILILILLLMSSPYAGFFTLNLINKISPPSCALRICYMFLTLGQSISMLFFLIETDDVRNLLLKIICKKRHTRVKPIAIINIPNDKNVTPIV